MAEKKSDNWAYPALFFGGIIGLLMLFTVYWASRLKESTADAVADATRRCPTCAPLVQSAPCTPWPPSPTGTPYRASAGAWQPGWVWEANAVPPTLSPTPRPPAAAQAALPPLRLRPSATPKAEESISAPTPTPTPSLLPSPTATLVPAPSQIGSHVTPQMILDFASGNMWSSIGADGCPDWTTWMTLLVNDAVTNGYGGDEAAWGNAVRLSIRNQPEAWKNIWLKQVKSHADQGKGRVFVTCLLATSRAAYSRHSGGDTSNPSGWLFNLTHGDNALAYGNTCVFTGTAANNLWPPVAARGESRHDLDSVMDAVKLVK